ncbi:MAG: glycosyltransferase family 2 protein [Cryomorphaceae bacterium]
MQVLGRVTILLPMKNAEPWLADCLYSICRQTYTHWECILVDDHSSDHSVQIASSFLHLDPRFRLIANRGNGIVDALNTALTKASGTWITRMDADDLMPPDKLALLWTALRQRKNYIATGKVRYFSPASVSPGYRDYEQWLNERAEAQDHWEWIYRECVIASANWLTHRDNVQFPSDVYPEDYSLVFDWYRKRLQVTSLSKITHMWREHPARTSRNSAHYHQPAFFRMKTARFVEIDRDRSRPLVVLGDNVKTNLLRHALESKGETPLFIQRSEVKKMHDLHNPQVLVGVFPSVKDRFHLEAWLADQGLKMGTDWFYT